MDEMIASLVSYILEGVGHPTIATDDTRIGAVIAEEHKACLTILDTDIVNEKQSTKQALDPFVTNRGVPLLILTADSERWRSLVGTSQTVKILQKPLTTPALLRQIRSHMATPEQVGELHFADVTACLRTRRIRRGGRRVHTSPTQFRMLCHLLRYPGQVVSRDELIEAVWKGTGVVDPRTVDAHVVHLRKALTSHGERDVIQTIRSAGYLLDIDG